MEEKEYDESQEERTNGNLETDREKMWSAIQYEILSLRLVSVILLTVTCMCTLEISLM